MKMRKDVSILLVAAMTIGMVTGCGSSSGKKTAKSDAKGKVYYLNFKPEQDEQWQELAEQYTDETGVKIIPHFFLGKYLGCHCLTGTTPICIKIDKK